MVEGKKPDTLKIIDGCTEGCLRMIILLQIIQKVKTPQMVSPILPNSMYMYLSYN
jgi:hypothetical protein